jgi:hypothetical protein
MYREQYDKTIVNKGESCLALKNKILMIITTVLNNILSLNLSIFYCQIYTIGLNTSFTTYMKFSPVSYKQGLTESMTDNKYI